MMYPSEPYMNLMKIKKRDKSIKEQQERINCNVYFPVDYIVPIFRFPHTNVRNMIVHYTGLKGKCILCLVCTRKMLSKSQNINLVTAFKQIAQNYNLRHFVS